MTSNYTIPTGCKTKWPKVDLKRITLGSILEAVKLSRVFELINTCFSVIKIRQDSHRINLCFYRFDLFSGKVYYSLLLTVSLFERSEHDKRSEAI